MKSDRDFMEGVYARAAQLHAQAEAELDNTIMKKLKRRGAMKKNSYRLAVTVLLILCLFTGMKFNTLSPDQHKIDAAPDGIVQNNEAKDKRIRSMEEVPRLSVTPNIKIRMHSAEYWKNDIVRHRTRNQSIDR
ncbi:MAG: hypothetical protein RR364_02000 [Lachnospiraceae bacterium]